MDLNGELNLQGGINITQGNLWNPVVHKGTAFPTAKSEGQLFYKTDVHTLYVYNGTSWINSSGTVTNPMTADLDAGGYKITDAIVYVDVGSKLGIAAAYWEVGTLDLGGQPYPLLQARTTSAFSDIGAIKDALIIYAPDPSSKPAIIFTDGTNTTSMTINTTATVPYFTVLGAFGVDTLGGGLTKAFTLNVGGLMAGNVGDGERICFVEKHGGGFSGGFDTAYIDGIMTDNTATLYAGALDFWTTDPGDTGPSKKMRLDQNGITSSDNNAFNFGDPTADGSWRIIRSGNNLIIERRVLGSWVTKETILA